MQEVLSDEVGNVQMQLSNPDSDSTLSVSVFFL